MLVTAVEKSKAEERDRAGKVLLTYNVLSKETVEPETWRQGERKSWKHPGTTFLGTGNSNAKTLG